VFGATQQEITAAAALTLYEQKKDLNAMPLGIVQYGSFHSARICFASSTEQRTNVR